MASYYGTDFFMPTNYFENSGIRSGAQNSGLPSPSKDITDPWRVISGAGDREGAASAANDQRVLAGQQYGETRGINDRLGKAESSYAEQANETRNGLRTNINAARQPYINLLGTQRGQIQGDMGQSTSQYGRGASVYDQLLKQGARDNKNAMSLADAMDPNNPVAQRYRQSQTARTTELGKQARQATAPQAAPNVAGVNPALLRSINQSRSGQAYAAAQRTMNDMRNQNFMYGVANSNNAYQMGQNALQNSNNIAQGYLGQNLAYNQEQGNLRNEGMNVGGSYVGEQAGRTMGQAQDRLDYLNDWNQANTNSGNRNLAAIGQRYGTDAASYLGQSQAAAGGAGGLLSGAGSLAGGAMAYGRSNPPQQSGQSGPGQASAGAGQKARGVGGYLPEY